MLPAFTNGEFLIVKKTQQVRRFDTIIFQSSKPNKQIRRIIGLPKEQVTFIKDTLYIDGKPLDEKFIVDEVNQTQRDGGIYTKDFSLIDINQLTTIPDNYYLVLGDNRPYATDSRHYGLIEKDQIIGVVEEF